MILTKQIALAALHQCQAISGDKGLALPEVITSEYTSASGAVVVDHDLKIIFVVFKGSKEFKDFVYDAKFHKDTICFVEDKPVRIHCGFSEQELSIKDRVSDVLFDTFVENTEYEVIITGHSLGGSIAEIYAARECDDRTSLITFGKACTGNKVFYDFLEENPHHNFRLYNEKDQIPKWLDGKFKYTHGGIPVELKDVRSEVEPANPLAAIFNHDTVKDYEIAIKALPDNLNERII